MIELAPRTEYEMTYENALLYCQFFEYNGYSDWRLPTKEEWNQYKFSWSWYLDRNSDFMWYVTPVMDI